MRLADFVSAILHLTMAFELFKAKDANQDNQIKMGLNEVSELIRSFFAPFFTHTLLLRLLVDQVSFDMLSISQRSSRLHDLKRKSHVTY
jgi:hypothetical protein